MFDDTYNAAPDSFNSALQTLSVLSAGTRRTVAILGEMKELGNFSSEAHRYVGQIAKQREVQFLVTVGEFAKEIADEATHLSMSKKHHFADADTACQFVHDFIEPNDIVLVKGSRAMQMEKIVQALTSDDAS